MSAAVAQKPKFSVAIQTDGYKKLINNTLQDPKRAMNFIANISTVVANNPVLQECETSTLLAAALLGDSLGLSLSPQLGHFYLAPFNDMKNNRTVATPIIGYKGYNQLAARTGQYKYINVIPVKNGELVSYDRIREEATFNWIDDDLKRETTETVGYYAYFEYINGFRKSMYWSKEKVMAHASRYSAAVRPAKAKGKFPGRVSLADYFAGKAPSGTEWVYSSHWYSDFDTMAMKTLLRQLISKWGAVSSEYVMAMESDGRMINQDLTPDLTIDTPEAEIIDPNNYNGDNDATSMDGQNDADASDSIEPETTVEVNENQISMSDLG